MDLEHRPRITARQKLDISVIIISIARDSLYRTLEGVLSQRTHRRRFEVILVLQAQLDPKRFDRLDRHSRPIRIISRPRGLGLSYYRNEGIRNARGRVLVFIDDDEWVTNETWLSSITGPIFSGEALVTTAGTRIPLTGSYLTDCAGYLGHPGGGNLGFPNMWHVTDQNWTAHLCSGNFAFSSTLGCRFDERLKEGSEDVELGQRLMKMGIKIKYVPGATLLHVPRSGLFNLMGWYFKRGKTLHDYLKNTRIARSQVREKGRAARNLFRNIWKTRYLTGVAFLFVLQHIAFLAGYAWARMTKRG